MAEERVKSLLKLDINGVGEWLKKKEFDETTVERFNANGVDGSILAKLNDRMIKDLFPNSIAMQIKFQCAIEESEEEAEEVSDDNESQQTAPETGWPTVFKLPKMPAVLFAALEEKNPEFRKIGRSGLRNKLINYVYEAMSKYEMYPTHAQYVEACTKLLQAYPFLRDKSSSGYALIHECLKNKFKKERVSLKEGTVDMMKLKYGRKRNYSAKQETEAIPAAIKIKRATKAADIRTEGENAESLKKHMAIMEKEMNKVSPNFQNIKDHWRRTYNKRRELVATASTQEVLKEFPAFKADKIVCCEIYLMYTTKIAQEMVASLARVGKKLSQQVAEKKAAKDLVEKIELKKQTVLTEDIPELDNVLALCGIPMIFNEKSDLVYTVSEMIKSPTPVIIVTGDVICPESLKIQMDGIDVLTNLPTIVNAMTMLIAVYYVYDIAYPKEVANSLYFIQRYLLKLDESRHGAPNTVLRLVGAIL